jgi:hypothetical protein
MMEGEENEAREFQVPNAPEEMETGEEPVARDLLAEEESGKEAALKAMVEGGCRELSCHPAAPSIHC